MSESIDAPQHGSPQPTSADTDAITGTSTPASLRAQLAGISTLSADALISLDENGQIRLFNRAAEKLFGRPAGEVLGKPSTYLFPKGLIPVGHSPDIGSPNTITSTVYESEQIWAVRNGGEHFQVQVTIANVEWSGKTVLVAQLKAEAAPQMATNAPPAAPSLPDEPWAQFIRQIDLDQHHLEAILQHMPAGLFIAEAPSGRLLLANKQAELIWRQPFVPLANVRQYSSYKAFHLDGHPYAPEEWPLARAIQSGEVVTGEEIDFIAGDGTHGMLSVSAAPIQDRHGRIVAGVMTFADVTEQYQVEHAVLTALHRTKELYDISQNIGMVRRPNDVLDVLLRNSYLQNCSHASILVFDTPFIDDSHSGGHSDSHSPSSASVYATWNKNGNASRLIARLIGQHLPIQTDWLKLIRLHEGPILVADLEADQSLPQPIREYMERLHTRSAALFPLIANGEWYGYLTFHATQTGLMKSQHVRHIQGLVDQAAVAIHNMRLLEAEAKARREAEHANELRLRFLAMISHELRTPLTSIKGFATTLLADDISWDQDTQRDFLKVIDTEANKLTDMIEQLLDLSRLEAGLLRIRPQAYTLNHILSSTVAQLFNITRNHRLHIAVPEDLPILRADQQRVAQVLINLVSNAAKYSPAQSDITIAAGRDGDFVQVSISDHGPGIPPHERQSVFEAFRRGEDNLVRHTKGAGLGLAICKGIIEAHGGRIWIADNATPGTTVSFTLPINT
ncbi:MAG: ATP-binding protein [Chloroflexi bacterium]|nr:ATP-binding protein [Chloroflexota bacterium]